MSADLRGRWISTQGYAEVVLGESSLQASLRYHAESGGLYHWLDGTFSDDDTLDVVVRSPHPETKPFRLGRSIFRGEPIDGVHPIMILLTDGATVLSLAYGPCSDEGNWPL